MWIRSWLSGFVVLAVVSVLAAQDSAKEKPPAKAAPPATKKDPSAAPKKPGSGKTTAEKPAAEKPAAKDDAGTAKSEAAADPVKAQQQFEAVFAEWKEKLKKIREVQIKFQTAEESEKPALHNQFDTLVAEAKAIVPKLKAAAEQAYQASPSDNQEIARFLVSAMNERLQHDDYDEVLRIGKILTVKGSENPRVSLYLGIAAFVDADYDLAEKHLKIAQERGLFNVVEDAAQRQKEIAKLAQMFLGDIDHYRKLWAEEQKIRAAEAKADNLPRVKLATSQGDVVIELYENEAPNTVANFVSLVEKGFYDGTTFHRVLPLFMAQGGDPEGTGSGGPGYRIRCECKQDNHRKHFRGTLSMAKTAAPDTGGSQFFLTFRPTSHLDGQHTVFGRVIEGFDVLPKLQRIDPNKPEPGISPDRIEKATVLRKRDHKYEPETLPAI